MTTDERLNWWNSADANAGELKECKNLLTLANDLKAERDAVLGLLKEARDHVKCCHDCINLAHPDLADRIEKALKEKS